MLKKLTNIGNSKGIILDRTLLQILEKPLVHRPPPQQLASDGARRGDVHREEGAEPAEVIEGSFRRDGRNGQSEVTARSTLRRSPRWSFLFGLHITSARDEARRRPLGTLNART